MGNRIDMAPWQGRVDPEPDGIRWHQRVVPLQENADAGITLIGFASDAGVIRNHGRPGARKGPRAIRQMLANLAWHDDGEQHIYDAGDIVCGDDANGGALEQAQFDLAERAAKLMKAGHRPILLGGGHAIAFASWQAIAAYLAQRMRQPRIGIINFDAHFDLRDPSHVHSSGTPFAQIADDCEARDWPFRYACLGVSRASNTAALFRRARELDVLLHDDRALITQPNDVADSLQQFIADVDHIYLTIDLDGLPAAQAPGVSAPAACGVPLAQLESLVERVRDSGKLQLADIAELNPDHDIDNRTARVAARLVHRLSHHS